MAADGGEAFKGLSWSQKAQPPRRDEAPRVSEAEISDTALPVL